MLRENGVARILFIVNEHANEAFAINVAGATARALEKGGFSCSFTAWTGFRKRQRETR